MESTYFFNRNYSLFSLKDNWQETEVRVFLAPLKDIFGICTKMFLIKGWEALSGFSEVSCSSVTEELFVIF